MSIRFKRLIQTIDSHTEGNSTRVIVGGVPVPPGTTLLERRDWLWQNDDDLRRMLNFEPRGHGMMCSVLLMPPISEGADCSIIIMEQDEYVPMCGHCLIGVCTSLVAAGMKPAHEPATRLRIETPAGLVQAEVAIEDGRIGSTSFVNVESFLLHDRVPIDVPGLGLLTVSVAYGGDFYCFVDADALGLELAPHTEGKMIDVAEKIISALNGQQVIRHPGRPDINRCYQTLFTSMRTNNGDVAQAIICPPGSLDRSPCGTGTSARVALMRTRGELALGQSCRFEGPLGTLFIGTAVSQEERDGIAYVRPKVTGRAYLTGFHQFVLDPADPLPRGFRIGPPPREIPAPTAAA
jgi:proline racemase